MANKETAPSPEPARDTAMEAADVVKPNPAEEARTQAFLDRFASTPAQAKEMREMIERKAPEEEWIAKYLKGRDPVGHYSRYFRAEVKKVVG